MGWTPGRICGRAALERRAHVCRETLHRHIYADAKAGGTLWACLPRARRKRKRRCPRVEGRGRGMIPGRRGIETRPASVGARKEVGRWEGGLVVGAGATGYLVTLVERVTRYTLVGWSAAKGARGRGRRRGAALGDGARGQGDHARQRQGVRAARGDAVGAECGRVLRPPAPLVGARHQREHQRPGPAAAPEGRVTRARHGGRPCPDRRIPERPPEEMPRLEDADGGDGRLPCRSRVSGPDRGRRDTPRALRACPPCPPVP